MSEKVITRKIKYCDKCGEPLEMLFTNGPVLGMDRHSRMCEPSGVQQSSRYVYTRYSPSGIQTGPVSA